MKIKLKKSFFIILSLILIVCFWQFLARIINQKIVFPSLYEIITAFFLSIKSGVFWTSLLFSFFRVIIAFIISLISGIVLGFLSGLSKNFHDFLILPLALIRSTPVVALIMIILFWFPSTVLPVICAVLMNLPVIIDSVSGSIVNADKNLLEAAKVFNVSFSVKLKDLYYPLTKPYIRNASHTVYSQSWKVVAAGEILSLPRYALGTMIQDYRILLEPSYVFALVILLTFISVISGKFLFYFFIKIEQLFLILKFKKDQKLSDESFYSEQNNTNPAHSSDFLISVKNLSFSYKENPVFNNYSEVFEPGKITGITAPTGSGKTTLLNILSGLISKEEYSGEVNCPPVSYIFQDGRLIPGVPIYKNISFVLYSKMGKKEACNTAFRILKSAGLSDYAFKFPENLSGGEKQIVQIVRALAYNAPVILMDEGTVSLDKKSKKIAWELILNFLKQNRNTLIFVSHDTDEIKTYSQRVVSI